MQQFAIIGLGRFGGSVAKTLYAKGHEVLAIDNDPEKVQKMASEVTHAVEVESTDEDALRSLGLGNFDCVIVAIGQDVQSSILTTLLCKQIGAKKVVAKAQNELHGKVLDRVGADLVIYPERDMGVRVANSLDNQEFVDYIELSPDHNIVEILARHEYHDMNLRQLHLRANYGMNVVAIKRGNNIIVNPGAEETVHRDDILVVIGSKDGLERYHRKR